MYLPEYQMPIGEVSTDDIIASATGCISVALVFAHASGPFPAEEYEARNQILVKAMGQFPAGTIFTYQDRYYRKRWKPNSGERPRSFLAQASDDHFTGRPYLENENFLFISRPADRRPVSWGSSALLRRHLMPATVLGEKFKRELLEQTDQFVNALNGSKHFHVRRLTRDELLGVNGQTGALEEYIYLLPPEQLPVIGDIAFQKEGVKALDRPCVIYTLADAEQLPEQCSPWSRHPSYSTGMTTLPTGFPSSLGADLGIEHIVDCYTILQDPPELLAVLEKRKKRLNSAAGHSRENVVARDAIDGFLQQAAEGNRIPVRMHVNVLAWAETPEGIPAIKQAVTAATHRLGAIPRLETVGAPQLWYCGIPGNGDQLPIQATFISFLEQAACFVNKESSGRDSAGKFGFRFCDRYTGRPLHVDLSDEPKKKQWIHNLNKLLIAPSGSGKSYLMLLMIRCYFESGAHIVVIDIGGSYRRLCSLLKGQYFAYSVHEPICFNPFRLEKGEQPDTERKESQKSLLLALWKKKGEIFRQSEYVALSNALHGYYQLLAAQTTIQPGFNSFYEFLRDIYPRDLADAQVHREDFDLNNFLYVLRPYYKGGEYDYLLNAEDQPSLLDERLIVFDIDAIKDHPILFPVVTIIIMEIFISKMRRLQGVRKVIVIEEAWKAIAKEGMDEYIKYLFKTVRKFFGEAIVVTQDVEDIISSPVVKNAIINNADTRILGDLSKFQQRFGPLQELLGLTEFQVAQILSVNKTLDPTRKYKEMAVSFASGPCRVYGIETSLEEYLAFTTEETERVLIERYEKEEGDLEKGIRKLTQAIRSGAVKLLLSLVFVGVLSIIPQGRANAQVLEIIGLINAAVKKVIVAADLQVQRLQTQTIALQDAEKALENSMAGDLLDDITNWVQQQEDLYGAYYQELWKVKSALSSYSKAATLVDRQVALVKEEQQDWAAVQKDPHFTVEELNHIASVYSGILTQSSRNIQQIQLVIQSFVTQMDDAGRLSLVDEASRNIDSNFQDLRQFTQENSLLSLQRAKDENDLLMIKILYNLP